MKYKNLKINPMLEKKRIIKTFLDLIKIDSPSGHEKEVGDFVLKYCKKIGLKANEDHYGNIIAKAEGDGVPILLSAHIDTVEPGRNIKAEIKNGVIKSVGDTILGADDKAGVTAILEAVKYLKENKIKHQALEIVFTREEELGVVGALNLNFKELKSKNGLVIDSSRPLGFITLASPFATIFEIKIKGKQAHAGSFPEKGVNAIQAAAKAISRLKVGRINKNTTNNFGKIRGGNATNIVPDEVFIAGEVRSLNLENVKKQMEIIKKFFKEECAKTGAKLFFNHKLVCDGYRFKKNDPFVKKIAACNKITKIKTVYGSSCGASDANIFISNKINAIDISYGGENPHSVQEKIKVSELVKLTEFVVNFIKK